MESMINDELKIYRGKDYFVKEGIVIHQPTLDEICEYGETDYWSMVYSLTSVGADLKFQLDDFCIDYTKISDFELFYSILCKNFPQKKTCLLFGELDFTKFELFEKQDTNAIVLFLEEADLIIDEFTYLVIMDVLRKMHGIKRNNEIPANETTRQILIEDAREEYNRKKDNNPHSILHNLVSAMINCEGFKYNHNDVWDMKINAFMDSVKRISKIKNADLLLTSGYSGFGINLKEVSSKQLDWLGELD